MKAQTLLWFGQEPSVEESDFGCTMMNHDEPNARLFLPFLTLLATLHLVAPAEVFRESEFAEYCNLGRVSSAHSRIPKLVTALLQSGGPWKMLKVLKFLL